METILLNLVIAKRLVAKEDHRHAHELIGRAIRDLAACR